MEQLAAKGPHVFLVGKKTVSTGLQTKREEEETLQTEKRLQVNNNVPLLLLNGTVRNLKVILYQFCIHILVLLPSSVQNIRFHKLKPN